MICKCCRKDIGKTTSNNVIKVEKIDVRLGRKENKYTKTFRICPYCSYENTVKRIN